MDSRIKSGSLRLRSATGRTRRLVEDGARVERPPQPAQLDLFADAPELRVYTEPRVAAEALSAALERGLAVAAMRAFDGLQIVRAMNRDPIQRIDFGVPFVAGGICGFTRRGAEVLLSAVQREARCLWARPAGPFWKGWVEWGPLLAKEAR